jgi:MFS family permease
MNNKSRWLSLIVLCTGFLLIVVDMTIVNVALPSIQRDLGFSQSGLAWVINAYLIAFGGLLLLAGRLGDLFGRKRVYLAGLAIFVGASLLCGLSFSQPMLIAARFVQGIGGAVSSAVILAMIVTLFPKPDEQAKAFGVFSFVASAGAAIGLLAGGLITQAVSWHWIFFVNLPIGIATAIAAARLLDGDRGIGIGKGADAFGAFLVTAALMLGVYTIVQCRWPCSAHSQPARHSDATRSCRCACSHRGSSPPPTSCRLSCHRPSSASSSSDRSTSSGSLVTVRWPSGWRSCPSRS